jgi:hypothetical protein
VRAKERVQDWCCAVHGGDGVGRVLIARPAFTTQAGGLSGVCLVLNTAAAEVIPTNDLPPSTSPLRAVVRCGTR